MLRGWNEAHFMHQHSSCNVMHASCPAAAITPPLHPAVSHPPVNASIPFVLPHPAWSSFECIGNVASMRAAMACFPLASYPPSPPCIAPPESDE